MDPELWFKKLTTLGPRVGEATGRGHWKSLEKKGRGVCVCERERENKRPRASSHSNHTSPDIRHEHEEG